MRDAAQASYASSSLVSLLMASLHPEAPSLPQGWRMAFYEGKPYYYGILPGDLQWDFPLEAAAPPPPPATRPPLQSSHWAAARTQEPPPPIPLPGSPPARASLEIEMRDPPAAVSSPNASPGPPPAPIVCQTDGSTEDRTGFGASSVIRDVGERGIAFRGFIKGSAAGELAGAVLGLLQIQEYWHEHRAPHFELRLDSRIALGYLRGGRVGPGEGAKLQPLIDCGRAVLKQIRLVTRLELNWNSRTDNKTADKLAKRMKNQMLDAPEVTMIGLQCRRELLSAIEAVEDLTIRLERS